MNRLHRFASAWEPAPRPAPPGVALLAVGDVHGYADHLDDLLRLLEDGPAAAARARGEEAHLVMVGDYVDRGPASLAVIDRVLALREAWGDERLHALCGNHDRLLADLVAGGAPRQAVLHEWRRKGGGTVLRELGLRPGTPAARLAPALRERLGPDRCRFLAGLLPSWRRDGWLFVHAGVHPRQPLDAQEPRDWLTLREPFLAGTGWGHPFAVVHGHTVRGPEVLPHRVAVDSGCYRTGVLAAVEIAGGGLRFHCVSERDDLAMLDDLPGARQGRRFERA